MPADAFPLIQVSGPPRRRGQTYGEAAADRIAAGAAHYLAQIGRYGIATPEALELAHGFFPEMAAFDPAYGEELTGIAEGSGRDLGEVVLLNARTEVLQLAARRARQRGVVIDADDGAVGPHTAAAPERPAADSDPDGCTGVIVLPHATSDGRLIHAQNWDWKVECVDLSIVLHVQRDDGPDLLTFTEAGALARSGLNARGIAITANYLESDRDYRQSGVPLPLIRRKALESVHLADAIRAVATTLKAASNNMMLSHRDGVGLCYECAPDEAFLVSPDRDGLLVHANHWVSPVALVKLRDTGTAATPDSHYRDQRLAQRLRPHLGAVTADTVKAALSDTVGSPYAILRPPLVRESGSLSATVATLVMDPAQGSLEAAPLPAQGARFTRYTLNPEA